VNLNLDKTNGLIALAVLFFMQKQPSSFFFQVAYIHDRRVLYGRDAKM
jgi:hypothetical protein